MYFPRTRNDVLEGEKNYPHFANYILNRETAKQLVRLADKKDSTAQNYLKRIKSDFKKHRRNGTWIEWCEDELVVGEWFVELYGKPSSAKFKKHILNKMTTYAEFNDGEPHPVKFTERR